MVRIMARICVTPMEIPRNLSTCSCLVPLKNEYIFFPQPCKRNNVVNSTSDVFQRVKVVKTNTLYQWVESNDWITKFRTVTLNRGPLWEVGGEMEMELFEKPAQVTLRSSLPSSVFLTTRNWKLLYKSTTFRAGIGKLFFGKGPGSIYSTSFRFCRPCGPCSNYSSPLPQHHSSHRQW